ncbi:MAG: hypothetical protein ACKPJJ_34930 [Planctomycetaceae bacterium]
MSTLTCEQAGQLIIGRLQACGQVVPAGAGQQAFWPLHDDDVSQLFKHGGVTPRMLLPNMTPALTVTLQTTAIATTTAYAQKPLR